MTSTTATTLGIGTARIGRRRFVQGAGALGALAATGPIGQAAGATFPPARPQLLTGPTSDLVVEEFPVNFTGRQSRATGVNGSVPGPILRWREGDTVTLNVTNRLREDTSIHWHGIRVPSDMDGVPGLSYRGIRPGETFTYRFPVKQSGTY